MSKNGISYVTDYNIYIQPLSSHNIGEVMVMEEKLVIRKKSLRGEDGCKVFSIRIKNETVKKLDDLAKKTKRSRNELINILLDYAVDNCVVE